MLRDRTILDQLVSALLLEKTSFLLLVTGRIEDLNASFAYCILAIAELVFASSRCLFWIWAL